VCIHAGLDIVVHVAEGACLRAVTVNGDVAVFHRLAYETRHHEVFTLVRAVGVEEAEDQVIESEFLVIGAQERLADILHDRIGQS
jgi:hypothetical protein